MPLISEACLAGMDSISLENMEKIKLMNRIDTKYVMSEGQFLRLIDMMRPHYSVQADKRTGEHIALYRTEYYDTAELAMYTMHEVGHATRRKIRMRSYVASDLHFVEIKDKSNRGRTDKKRCAVPSSTGLHHPDADALLRRNNAPAPDALHPSLRNEFHRLTLVDHAHTERVTIDFDIAFFNPVTGINHSIPGIVVVEVKRDGRRPSKVTDLLCQLHIHQAPFSKYLTGMALTSPGLRANRIKPRLRLLQKLLNSQ